MKNFIFFIILFFFITIFPSAFDSGLVNQNLTPRENFAIAAEEESKEKPNEKKEVKTDTKEKEDVSVKNKNQTILSDISNKTKTIIDNLLTLIFSIIKIILFGFLIIFFIWFLRLSWKGRRSLNILPIVNETGETGVLEGVASGIDDILISRLQDIGEKSSLAQVKHSWLSPSSATGERKNKPTAQAQLLNIMGGGVSIDLQKLGDISAGPIKIPLGTIIAFITKMFGGNYVSGALQKYGRINKIVLKLEKSPSLFKRNIHYFEVTWHSEDIKIDGIAEGVPYIINELAYRITLDLSEGIGTENWKAYKYFLEGILAFRDFEENRTRKDRLKDAISRWRESVRLDQNFAKAHYNLGFALDMDEKYEDAIFRYNKVIHMSPELAGAEAHYNLAKIYWDIYNDESKTLEELKKAKTLDPNLANIYNLEGVVYSKRKEVDKEVEMYQEAIRRSKGERNPVFYYNLSVARYYQANYTAAQTAGEEAIKIYGDKEKTAALLQTMGLIHISKGEYEKALDYFKEGLMKEPENLEMLSGYGRTLSECGDLDKALLIQRRFIRLWPEYGMGYSEIANTLKRLRKPDNEVAFYEKIGNALSTIQISEISMEDGVQKFKKDFAAAINLNKAILLHQKIFSCAVGCILHYSAKYNDANNSFVKMLQKKFKGITFLLEPETLHTYGINLKKLGEQADTALQAAVSLYHEEQFYDLAQCYDDLAESYEKIKLYKEADEAYKKAIDFYKKEELFNLASDTHVKDSECLMDWFRAGGDVEVIDWAIYECNEAIRLDNSNDGAFHVKGNIYYYLKRYAEAIPQYEKTVEIKYDLPGAHYNLGLCYMNLGNYEEATNKFETTIKLDEMYADPNNEDKPDPYKYLSICLERIGRLDKAVETLRLVANMFPTSVKYHLLLGQVLVKSNLLDEALEQFNFCIDFDKQNTQNLKHLALNSLAEIYVEQGADIEEAYKKNRNALVLCKPKVKSKSISAEDLSSIRNTLGWIFYQKGQIKKAIAFLQRSLIHVLGDPKSHARLAYAYEKFSMTCSHPIKADYLEKARAQWRTVLDSNDKNRWREIAEEHLKLLFTEKKKAL